MLQHPECTLDLRGKTVDEYIWSIYNQAYEDFSKGISQLLIAKNADNQLKGFVFLGVIQVITIRYVFSETLYLIFRSCRLPLFRSCCGL
jgi:uncharacterized membrane protein YobD (UPF0266 family)